ncbi:MAG: hypothetical protein AB7R40_24125 [Nitrospiraceae bacterium]
MLESAARLGWRHISDVSVRTMTSDLDIYRSAKAMLDQHGHAAPLEAAMRADKLLSTGNLDGQRVWLRILKAIDELQGVGTTKVRQ